MITVKAVSGAIVMTEKVEGVLETLLLEVEEGVHGCDYYSTNSVLTTYGKRENLQVKCNARSSDKITL